MVGAVFVGADVPAPHLDVDPTRQPVHQSRRLQFCTGSVSPAGMYVRTCCLGHIDFDLLMWSKATKLSKLKQKEEDSCMWFDKGSLAATSWAPSEHSKEKRTVAVHHFIVISQ